MAKRNLVKFQKGMSITVFLVDFGMEKKCAEALARLALALGIQMTLLRLRSTAGSIAGTCGSAPSAGDRH